MKPTFKQTYVFLMALALILLSGCVSITPGGEGLVMGENYRLSSGETLDNDLTVLGGNAIVEQGATVKGDVAVVGGNVTIEGSVEGDVSVLGGNVNLRDTALITGDVNSLGGSVRRDAGAEVRGDDTGGRSRLPIVRSPLMQVNFDPILGPLTAFFQAIALATLAIVLHLFAARHMERTGQTAIAQPVAAGGIGLLTTLVSPALLLIMAITIILLPLSILGILALALAGLFGWLSLGLMLGRQMTAWLKQTWSDPISAGIGTLTLTLVSSLLGIIPCIGWLAGAVAWLIGLGAVVLTRFGTQYYPSTVALAHTAPAVTTAPGAQIYNPPPADPPVDSGSDAA